MNEQSSGHLVIGCYNYLFKVEIILHFCKDNNGCNPSKSNRFTEVKYWMWNLYRKKRVETTALSAHYLSTMFGWVVMVDKKNFWLRHCYFNNFHFISVIFLHISYIYVCTLHYFMRCIWQVLGCKKLVAMSSALKKYAASNYQKTFCAEAGSVIKKHEM